MLAPPGGGGGGPAAPVVTFGGFCGVKGVTLGLGVIVPPAASLRPPSSSSEPDSAS